MRRSSQRAESRKRNRFVIYPSEVWKARLRRVADDLAEERGSAVPMTEVIYRAVEELADRRGVA